MNKWLYIIFFLIFTHQFAQASSRTDLFLSSLNLEKEIWPGFVLKNKPIILADKEMINEKDLSVTLILKLPLNESNGEDHKIFRITLDEKDSIVSNFINQNYGTILIDDEFLEKFSLILKNELNSSFINSLFNLKGTEIYFWSFLPNLDFLIEEAKLYSDSQNLAESPQLGESLLKVKFSPEMLALEGIYKEVYAELPDKIKKSKIGWNHELSYDLGNFFHEAIHFIFQRSDFDEKTWPNFADFTSDDEVFHVCYDGNEKTRILHLKEMQTLAEAFTKIEKLEKLKKLKQFFQLRNERYELNKNIELNFSFDGSTNFDCPEVEARQELHEGWPQFYTFSIPLEMGIVNRDILANDAILLTLINLKVAESGILIPSFRPTASYYFTGAMQWILMRDFTGEEKFKNILLKISQLKPDQKFYLSKEL